MKLLRQKPSVELHDHLGSAVSPPILWSIAHRQGIKLPTKDYWEFEDMITMTGNERNRNLDEMHRNFFHWTELIQSSPEAIEESVKSVIGGGYRKCNILVHELRFCPMKRNRGGERDLDHIIMSGIWGLDRAILEYPQVKAGLILMMDRMLTFEQNQVIVKKAIKYKSQGIIGIDLAGPNRKSFSMKKHAPLFAQARKAGLGLTVHTGEEAQLDEMRFVVKVIRPDRIGHGVQCVKDKPLMREISRAGITLEICPTSNLRNSVIKNTAGVKKTIRALLKNKIKFSISTDGPEMYTTNIYKEYDFLLKNRILSQKELDQTIKWGMEASFIKN
ncbi:MAG: adenosine deaminase [Patescibacteria group bacterium]